MRNWWRLTIWAALVVAALWFLWRVSSVLTPFVLAWLITSFMEPTIKKLRAAGYSRGRAVFLVFFCFFMIITATSVIVVPSLISQFRVFNKQIPQYVTEIEDLLKSMIPTDKELKRQQATLAMFGLPADRQQIYDEQIAPHIADIQNYAVNAGKSLLSKLSAVFSLLITIILTPILTFFLMMDYDTIRRRTVRLIPMSIRGQSIDLFDDIGDVFTNYLRGMLTSAVIYATCASLVYWFLGLPVPLLLGVLAGCFSIAPYIGFLLSTTMVLIAAMVVPVEGWTPLIAMGGQGAHVVGSLALYIVYDQSYGLFVLPRIMGRAVGIHIFMAFFAIAAGGTLFGLPGLVLAYPVAGSIKLIAERILGYVVDDRPKVHYTLPRIPLRFRARSPV